MCPMLSAHARTSAPVQVALMLLVLGTLLAPPGLGGQQAADGSLASGFPGASGGQEACASCHEEAQERFRGRLLSHADSVTCLSCHHIGFTNEPDEAAERRLEACASCHVDLPPAHDPAPPDAGATLASPGMAEQGGRSPTCGSCHALHDDPPIEDAGAAVSGRCVACHESPHPLHAGTEAGEEPLCTDCHSLHETGSVGGPGVVQGTCVSCHEEVHPSHPAVGEDAVECSVCHSLAADAPVAPAGTALTETCVSCHEEVPPAHEGHDATCTDCHSFESDPPLESSTVEMSRRCGDCHEEAMDGYRSGGHAAGLAADRDEDLPTCVSCHDGHVVGGQDPTYVRLTATGRCVECHSDPLLTERHDLPPTVGQSYTDDFHGATVQFLLEHPEGEDHPSVMTCSDCHGAHRVEWEDQAVVAEVCARCHDGNDANLAGAWLGHTPAGPDNQVVIWLLRLFYYVLIPFMLVGLVLHIGIHFLDQKRRGARMATSEGMRRIWSRLRGEKVEEMPMVERFSRADRMEHMGTMASFILLVVTGLPQTWPDMDAAQAVIGLFGGITATRWVHRIAGLFFVALVLAHVVRTVYRALQRRRLPVMVPGEEDFRDALALVRHYIWGTPKPKVGKFDFFQKFEYWGLFLGGIVMASTGFLLLFPDFFTVFLPGIVVAAARVMHGLEATFATLVVVLWHSYGVVFRPEIFPLDTSIFTGKVSVERLKHEHPREYERLFPEEAEAAEAEEAPVLPVSGDLAGVGR